MIKEKTHSKGRQHTPNESLGLLLDLLTKVQNTPYYERGLNALYNGDLDAADDEFNLASITDQNLFGFVGRGYVSIKKEKYSEASEYFLHAQRERTTVHAILGLAITHAMKKQYLSAARLYRQLTSLLPDEFIIWMDLGLITYHLKDSSSAKKLIGQALDIEPNSFQCHFLLGRISYNEGRFHSALEAFTKAAELDRRPHIAYWLAITQCYYGKLDSAFRNMSSVKEQFFQREYTWMCLGICTLVKDPRHAIDAFQKATRINKNNPSSWFYLALSHLLHYSKDPDIEMDIAISHIDNDIDRSKMTKMFSLWALRLKLTRIAIKYLRMTIQLNQGEFWAHQTLEWALRKIGATQAARAVHDIGVELLKKTREKTSGLVIAPDAIRDSSLSSILETILENQRTGNKEVLNIIAETRDCITDEIQINREMLLSLKDKVTSFSEKAEVTLELQESLLGAVNGVAENFTRAIPFLTELLERSEQLLESVQSISEPFEEVEKLVRSLCHKHGIGTSGFEKLKSWFRKGLGNVTSTGFGNVIFQTVLQIIPHLQTILGGI